MKKLTDEQKAILSLNEYEYLDGRYCYAKVGGNVAVQQAQDGDFYITIAKYPYIRGVDFQVDGIFVGYFKTINELLQIVNTLSKYKIK